MENENDIIQLLMLLKINMEKILIVLVIAAGSGEILFKWKKLHVQTDITVNNEWHGK